LTLDRLVQKRFPADANSTAVGELSSFVIAETEIRINAGTQIETSINSEASTAHDQLGLTREDGVVAANIVTVPAAGTETTKMSASRFAIIVRNVDNY
jgi:hypothetical protein